MADYEVFKKRPKKEYQDELPKLKKAVEDGYRYLKPNYMSFKNYNQFVYASTLNETDREVLRTLGKPELEFNLMYASTARLLGEFGKHEPSITLTREPGVTEEDVPQETLDILEAHFRHEITEANKDGFQYQGMQNILSGWAVGRVWTEYANSKSFELVIKFGNVEPTLAFFDPNARLPHKGDGGYFGFMYYHPVKEIKEQYTFLTADELRTQDTNGEFRWSYREKGEDGALVCELYKKKKEAIKILRLSNGQSVEEKDYEKLLESWENFNRIEQPPIIVDERTSYKTIICKYVFIENALLQYKETDFEDLPAVWGDGDSRMLPSPTGDGLSLVTRPYGKDLVGVQKLTNLAGQSWANELENITQQKVRVAKEAIPDEPDYLQGYTASQFPSVLVYNGFKDNNPEVPLPPPETINRQPIPPDISQAFLSGPQTSQAILGSYEAELGINEQGLSGKAIALGAIQSNATAKPYLYGYLSYLTQLLQVSLNLFPKIYKTARTIPILERDGKRSFVEINNKEGGAQINFAPGALKVSVEAGPSFAIQKSMTIDQITKLSSSMPIFSEFINTKGLGVLVDNLDIRGADRLKELSDEFIQELEQRKQVQEQQMQQEQQNNPVVLAAMNERMKIESQERQAQVKAQIDTARLMVDEEKNEVERLKILSSIDVANAEKEARMMAARAEETRASIDMMIKITDLSHTHAKEKKEIEHNMNMDLKSAALKKFEENRNGQ